MPPSPGQRLSRQWPPVPCSFLDPLWSCSVRADSQANARKLPSSSLRYTPSADERSTPASPCCLTSVTFLRSSMSSPRRSWRGCRWSLLMSLPMSSALLLCLLAAGLDVSWSRPLEVLDDSRSETCSTVWPLQDNASWMSQPVDCSPFLAGSVVLWHSGFW